jgi:15-cis-phytoene synthase
MLKKTAVDAWGSDIYCCLRKVSHKKRSCIQALEQFFETIYSIPLTLREDSVAIAKLHWWQQEIERMKQGKATHAIARTLQDHAINTQPLLNLIEATAGLLHYARFENLEDLATHFVQTFGLITNLIGQQCGTVDSQLLHQVGLGLGLCYHLSHVRPHLSAGFVFFSESDMAQQTVTQQNLLSGHNKDQVTALLAITIERARTSLNITLPKEQRYLRHRIRLDTQWLDAIANNPAIVLQYQVNINPLLKLVMRS